MSSFINFLLKVTWAVFWCFWTSITTIKNIFFVLFLNVCITNYIMGCTYIREVFCRLVLYWKTLLWVKTTISSSWRTTTKQEMFCNLHLRWYTKTFKQTTVVKSSTFVFFLMQKAQRKRNHFIDTTCICPWNNATITFIIQSFPSSVSFCV